MPYTTPALAARATVHHADALFALADIAEASVDAVVTDPPYAIRRVPTSTYDRPAVPAPGCPEPRCRPGLVCPECDRMDRVAKFANAAMLGQQSQNWHAKETHSRGYADNDPRQFQSWCELWLAECLRVLKPGGHLVAFGGTRTWHRLAAAAENVGFEIRDSLAWLYSSGMPKSLNVERALEGNAHGIEPTEWAGWGTALKPAFEPIVLGRRPLEGTMVENINAWGVGPLHLKPRAEPASTATYVHGVTAPAAASRDALAADKWPTNVHLHVDQAAVASTERGQDAARFFWISKPGKSERVVVDGVAHPTVKPLDLMQRLVRLVTPADGLVLDPFAGSGTTIEACLLEGMRVVGIERDLSYLPLIECRIVRAKSALAAATAPTASAQPQAVQGGDCADLLASGGSLAGDDLLSLF